LRWGGPCQYQTWPETFVDSEGRERHISRVSTLTEIERAVDALPSDQKKELIQFLAERLRAANAPTAAASPQQHGVLDIPPVSLGKVLRPLSPDDDLLGEMLKGRVTRHWLSGRGGGF
jgi:hypothetical protein